MVIQNQSLIGTNGLIQNSYTASSTYSSDSPAGAFDGCEYLGGTSTTKVARGAWLSNTNQITNQWLQVNYGDLKINITKIRFYSGNVSGYATRNPKNCTLKGSNDGINFVDIYSFVISAVNGWQEFIFTNTNFYNYYRLFMANTNGATDFMQVGEFELWGIKYIDKYLIKQNLNYYTIKSENYDSTTIHNFTPLTLTGETNPNSSDIENFGFDDLNLLTNSMTVGSDTFIPVLKFDNTAELKLYKPN